MADLQRSRALVRLDVNGYLMPIEPVTPPRSHVWKVVHFPIALMVVAVALLVIGGLGANVIARGIRLLGHIGTPALMIAPALSAAVVVLVYWVFARYVERRREFDEFETYGMWRELAAGFGGGLALFSAVYAVIALLGGFSIYGFNAPFVLIVPFVTAVCTGIIEEIILRGLFFRLVERLLGSWIALVLSAALFGLAHLANPNATLFAGVAIMLEAGVMLAAVYMVTRRLWAAIALHAAWNFAQGGIYGVAVSGFAQQGLIQTHVSGSEWLTGGLFGAEASLPAILIDTATGIALLVIAARRGRIVAPSWTRRRKKVALGAG